MLFSSFLPSPSASDASAFDKAITLLDRPPTLVEDSLSVTRYVEYTTTPGPKTLDLDLWGERRDALVEDHDQDQDEVESDRLSLIKALGLMDRVNGGKRKKAGRKSRKRARSTTAAVVSSATTARYNPLEEAYQEMSKYYK